MKIIAILILCCTFSLAATTYAQEFRVSIHKQNSSIRDILREIEENSEFTFFYNDNQVNVDRKTNINANNSSLEDVLAQVLSNTGYVYQIIDRQVLIKTATVNNPRVLQAGRRLTGSVVDLKNEPIIGANVVIKGTTTGTITDFNGNFTLNVPENAILIISYIGYTTTEITVGNQSNITVVIEEDTEKLDEVIVVGYGTARKGDLTGAISSIKGETLTNRSTQQLSTSMQGQISGVQVTRSSGEPGSSATIRVRGVTTLSNNDPLVIVDGVPSSLNDVISSDVETMTVLKDAASASIYGSRAAAGVILITTKRAKEQQFSFDYNYEYAIDKPTARPTNGNVIDWMNIQNEVKWNDGASDPYSQYSQETIGSWLSNNAIDPYHYPNTDWVDLLLKNSTSHEQHVLSVSGGTEKLRTKSTLNYQKGDGYYENKSYERIAGRVNNDYKITDWFRANIDLDFSKSNAISPSQINAIYWAYLVSPYYTPYWEDGRYADVKDGANPIAGLQQGGRNKTNYYKFGGKAQIDITPLKGLTLSAIIAPRFAFTKGKKFTRAVPVYYENGSTTFMQSHKTTNLLETRNDNNSLTYQFYGNYQKTLGDHSFSAMAGYEGYSYRWENQDASRTNYLLDTYPYLNIGPEDYQYNSGSAGHNAYESGFGRLMYSYKNKYMIQGNVRTDGSSRFAKDNRWGTFYSMSAGWVMSEESWFKNDLVDYLKIRGSIGQLGNERIGSEFPYQAAINFGNSYMYDKSSQSVIALQNAAQVYYAFNNITWETTETYGAGLDFSMFNNRLRFTGDYYYKKTSDMLLTLGFPSYAGFSAPTQNAGDMYTKGYDLELSWSDQIGDFSYSVSANLSDYRSKMGYLGDKRTINGNYIYEEGSYYNEWYMYKTDGLFQTDADLYDADGNKYPTLTANDKAGNIKYVDVDENGVINSDDKVRMGNSQPEYLYGGNISVGWKSFDLNLSFQGIGHQRVLFNSAWIQPLKEQWGAVPSLVLGDYWSQHNTEEQNLKAKYPRLTYTNTTNTYTGSDYWLFNGAYFRMKNITLGYSLPKEILNKISMKNIRLYFSVNDLPAISNYPKGWDPEIGSSSDFISTSFLFGVNVKF
ncbi:TonB-dependent receptor [Massilibacteroides sp.]|uniref:TonB-dependent receptor n=1 Tax=Massilibacteroides sp. TaxID=2034766 RepID=UPI00260F1F1A|nr:TonB-dependent receptor [Massilibacteroides sp.]MDD4515029.1 TonB-dependent receptor [Massilibacteroides sp.]